MQDEIAAEQEGAYISEKEEKLNGRFMGSVIESEDEGHSQVGGTKEAENEKMVRGEAPGRVPGV